MRLLGENGQKSGPADEAVLFTWEGISVRRCSNSRVSRICESVSFVTVARISLGYSFSNAETVQKDAFGACGGDLLIQRARTVLSLKRPLPVTSCTVCASAGYNLSLTDLRCAKSVGGERCKGTNSSARNVADWLECALCQGIGAYRNAPCARCGGVGWYLARKAS